MSDTYFLGVDIGTTGVKTVLLHVTRGIVAQATHESVLHSIGPAFAEADASSWMRSTIAGIQQVLSESGVSAASVKSLATTGMVPAVVCLDADLEPVRRPILQNDARATREIDELAPGLDGAGMLAATGSALTQQSLAPTLLWLQRHEPEAWKRTRLVVGSYDYVLIALGARPHAEQNWGIESGLFRLDSSHFEPALNAIDLDAALLPTLERPGQSVGVIAPAVAEATGLHRDTALIVGGADHVLSAFSAGVEKPGDWLVKLGGAGDILSASRTPITDARLYLDAHPKEGLWLPNGCMATSGSLIRWFQAMVGGTPLADLDDHAAARRPADVLCLPYFLGEKSPINDPALRGAFVGLELRHTAADLYRSVLEAIAFGFRHNTEVLRSMGVPLTRALVTNGGSKSVLWKSIHANVLDTDLLPVLDHPGASLGAAILAGIGVGELGFDDTARFLQFDKPITPDPTTVERYDEAYLLWRELGDVLAPVSHKLAAGDSSEGHPSYA